MRKRSKNGTVIARVTAGDPPASVKTLREWLAWRAEEDRRMEAELQAQCETFIQRDRTDPTLH